MQHDGNRLITYMHYWKVRMLSPVLTDRPQNRVCDGSLIYSQVSKLEAERDTRSGIITDIGQYPHFAGSSPALTTKASDSLQTDNTSRHR